MKKSRGKQQKMESFSLKKPTAVQWWAIYRERKIVDFLLPKDR
jgi:hypothetical protein